MSHRCCFTCSGCIKGIDIVKTGAISDVWCNSTYSGIIAEGTTQQVCFHLGAWAQVHQIHAKSLATASEEDGSGIGDAIWLPLARPASYLCHLPEDGWGGRQYNDADLEFKVDEDPGEITPSRPKTGFRSWQLNRKIIRRCHHGGTRKGSWAVKH